MQQDSTNSDSVMDLDAGPSPDMDVDAVAADTTFESQADPAAASLVWHTRPDGTVQLPAPAAVMDDADDAEEDDVDMLQVDEHEVDDDVTAVDGDILGVGPTWGTTAGDPTSNLGRLGPQLLQQVAGDADDAGSSRGHGGVAGTRSSEQPPLVFPQAQAAGLGAAGGGVGDTPAGAAAATDGNASAVLAGVLGVGGGHLSEGDADVRGIAGQVVHEDADNLPAGFELARLAADSAAVGPDDAPAAAGAVGRVGQLGGLAGGATGGGGDAVGAQGLYEAPGGGATAAGVGGDSDGSSGGSGSDPGVEGEYGPHEVDGVEAGDIDKGGFEPASYVRHRSQGQTGIDPDTRSRPDPDPAGGLRSLLGATSEAAGAVAAIEGMLPAAAATAAPAAAAATRGTQQGAAGGASGEGELAAAVAAATGAAGVLGVVLGDGEATSSHAVHKGDFAMGAVAMPALTDEAVLVTDYTEEPKYAAEVPRQLPGPAERSTDAAAAPAGAEDGEGGGVSMGSGQPQVLVVGHSAGPAAYVGGGKQQQKQSGCSAP